MSENPYQPPASSDSAVGVLSGSRKDLRSVAQYQKVILLCILFYLVAVAAQFFIPAQVRPVLGLAILLVGLVGAICVVLLAIRVYGIVLGIILGLLTLIPLINLLILLMVNGKATGILRQNGIQVGFLGAKNVSAI